MADATPPSERPPWPVRFWRDCARSFETDHAIYWPHLSRATGLLVMLNVSLFFLNDAVSCGGNYWPLKSLGLLVMVEVAMLWPHGLGRRFGYYAALMAFWLAALGFFIASVSYWLVIGAA